MYVAVSVDEITQEDLRMPNQEHPFLTPEGRIDPIWHRFLSDTVRMINSQKELLNAVRTEVNTQHP